MSWDDERWPISVVTFPESYSTDDWREFIDQLGVRTRRREPFVVLVDERESHIPNALERKLVAEWQAAEVEWTRYIVANPHIVSSGDPRIAVGLITAQVDIPYPVQFFDSKADAIAWAQRCLNEAHTQTSGG